MRVLITNEMRLVSGGSKRSERLKGQNAFAQVGVIAAGSLAGAVVVGAVGGFAVGGPVGASTGALYGGLTGAYGVIHFRLHK